jgi:hypothetical protein
MSHHDDLRVACQSFVTVRTAVTTDFGVSARPKRGGAVAVCGAMGAGIMFASVMDAAASDQRAAAKLIDRNAGV